MADLGVVRAFRWVTIDEIKPGMTLLDTSLGQERVVQSVAITVKGDLDKSVRIKFTDGKYARLSYPVYEEHRFPTTLSMRPISTTVLGVYQHRFKEAYDLNVNLTVQALAKEEAQKIITEHQINFHPQVPSENIKQAILSHVDEADKPKRRWFR